MVITNLETVPGYETVEHYGLAQGSSVRSKHVGRDMMAGLKNLFGGELKGYTELLNESREEAIKRLTAQANSLGANAVVNVRFSTSSITAGASEIFAYGTAVRIQK
ncbi:MAG: YbjQ family protein [Bdellovibrionales bacterium]